MKKTIISIWILLFLFSAHQTFGQQRKIDVTIHSRVDTTQREIKEVAMLWINYLNSKPDSLHDNPYWNNAEKVKFKNFDLSTPYMYQFPSEQLLNYYKPTILSIEKEGEYYGIRTIFSADALQGEYRKSNPWCITKLYAVKEGGKWRLKNALPIITEKWNKRTIGKITFIYPPHHKFNNDLATKASQFCNEITEKFKFPEWEPFDFYITDSGDELGKLLNFDFYFAGYTTGIGMNDNRILLSGFGSEYYPHEFIHLIVPKFDRHDLIEEGFATWKGGQGGKTFEQSAKLFANELAKNDTVTFLDVLNRKWGWQYAAFYTTGAILCNFAFEKGGVKLVNELLNIPNDTENLVDNLCLVFGIDKKDFDKFWRNETLKFTDN
ncbi:MAG: hypothetical protein M9949_02070 [Candidatus Kapabacteria bacterium]|nr:hypothetical protein [Candidatus Kapabacteria bacterium]